MLVYNLRAQSYDIIFYNTSGCDEILIQISPHPLMLLILINFGVRCVDLF